MFTSATLKLTTWYLVIVTVISVIFSIIIFEISTSEISTRLERLQIRVEGSSRTLMLPGPVTLTDLRESQAKEAEASLFIGLLYMNLAVIGLGGIGSFLLARITLRPIEIAHDAQSRFTSDASHELRTPLAVMKSEIQVALKDNSMKPADYRQVLESTLEEVDKLTALSQSLLQLSRMEFDEIKKTDRIDIATTVRSAARSLSIPSDRLKYTAPAHKIIIDGNQSIIADLFHILLDNAVKYSPPDSKIAVKVASNGRTCKISITNEGAGIAKTDLARIFDRFYRAEKARSSSQNPAGYGLGLSLAKHIVSIHDGSIEARSTPGAHTDFIVQLPQVRKNR